MRWELNDEGTAWERVLGPVDNREYISSLTGFDNGEYFDSDDEVRQYFRDVPELLVRHGYPPLPEELLDDLEEMAETVIRHRWHYAHDIDGERSGEHAALPPI